jgi:hypothetical protein
MADLDAPASNNLPVKNAVVYYFAPPPDKGVTDRVWSVRFDGVVKSAQAIVLISTTGVYGIAMAIG